MERALHRHLPPARRVARLEELRRLALLGLLSTLTGKKAKDFRGLRWTVFFLALSGIGGALLTSALGAPDVSDVLALRVLAYAAWLFGVFGLSALLKHKPGAPPELGRLRGFRTDRLEVRAAGLGLRLFWGMFLAAAPGLLTAWMVAPPELLGARASLFLLAQGYLALLAASLGILGALSERAIPRYPRVLAILLALGPFAAAFVVPAFPSLPGAFIYLFEGLVRWGAPPP